MFNPEPLYTLVDEHVNRVHHFYLVWSHTEAMGIINASQFNADDLIAG